MPITPATTVAAALAAVIASGAAAGVDFERDVAPILRQHCLRCHGPQRQSNGLRLDERVYAEAGGASGRPILGGTLETNELYRRVTAIDDEDRMPRFAGPLAAEQLARLAAWVEAGTPWPDERVAGNAAETPRTGVYRNQIAPILPYLLVVMIGGLGLEMLKRRLARPQSAAARAGVLAHIRLAHLLVGAGVLLMARQISETAKLHARLVDALAAAEDDFGDPPIPRRPDHPRRLEGTYYRGNCERDERLFNGGNYRTCSFHVALCDASGRAVDYGDPVPAGGLFVGYEVERAAGTTERMFTDDIMAGVLLADRPIGTEGTAADGVMTLDVVEPGWRWRARYPVEAGGDGPAEGMIYVHRGGRHPDGTYAAANVHYGIRWVVVTESGRIVAPSELWMGAIFRTPGVSRPPDRDKVPFESWFDHRPIQIIEGANTDDPVLLGLPDGG